MDLSTFHELQLSTASFRVAGVDQLVSKTAKYMDHIFTATRQCKNK